MPSTPDLCPNCGANIPRKAKACPECGSCESTGWSDDAYASNLGLPDDSFDYDEFVKKEFGEEKPKVVPYGLSKFWWIVGIILLVALVLMLFRF